MKYLLYIVSGTMRSFENLWSQSCEVFVYIIFNLNFYSVGLWASKLLYDLWNDFEYFKLQTYMMMNFQSSHRTMIRLQIAFSTMRGFYLLSQSYEPLNYCHNYEQIWVF